MRGSHTTALVDFGIGKIDPLEYKHRVLMTRQRAVHHLQRRMLDRTYRQMKATEDAAYFALEDQARARDAGKASNPAISDALNDLEQASADAYHSVHPQNNPFEEEEEDEEGEGEGEGGEEEEMGGGGSAAAAGGGPPAGKRKKPLKLPSMQELLHQQRLSHRALVTRCAREMEEPCHTDVVVAGDTSAGWKTSQEKTIETTAAASAAASAPSSSTAASSSSSSSSGESGGGAMIEEVAKKEEGEGGEDVSGGGGGGGGGGEEEEEEDGEGEEDGDAAVAGGTSSKKRERDTSKKHAEEAAARAKYQWAARYAALRNCARCGAHVPKGEIITCDSCNRDLCGRGGASATEPLAGPCISWHLVPGGGSKTVIKCYDCALGYETRASIDVIVGKLGGGGKKKEEGEEVAVEEKSKGGSGRKGRR